MERLPPGKTCAEGKELEVLTRWRRRISLVGDSKMMLALGRGGTGVFGALGWEGVVEEEEAVWTYMSLALGAMVRGLSLGLRLVCELR